MVYQKNNHLVPANAHGDLAYFGRTFVLISIINVSVLAAFRRLCFAGKLKAAFGGFAFRRALIRDTGTFRIRSIGTGSARVGT